MNGDRERPVTICCAAGDFGYFLEIRSNDRTDFNRFRGRSPIAPPGILPHKGSDQQRAAFIS